MVLFIFFALPVATILLSIVLQKVLKCPILVAITFFSIYLIIAFVVFLENLGEALVATFIYTVISFLASYITMMFSNLTNRLSQNYSSCSCQESNIQNCCCNNNGTNCTRTQNGNVAAVNANFTPCQNNSNRGCIRGCYRRR